MGARVVHEGREVAVGASTGSYAHFARVGEQKLTRWSFSVVLCPSLAWFTESQNQTYGHLRHRLSPYSQHKCARFRDWEAPIQR